MSATGNDRRGMPFLVGIAGGTGAGKTTVARRLAEILTTEQTVCLLDLDSYYKDLSLLLPEERERVNFDHPDSLDLKRFLEDLHLLRQGQAIIKPMYDFKTHTRYPGGSLVVPGDVVIVEGLMLFVDDRVRGLFDLKIYIDTPSDIRLRRRFERDVRERGRTLTSAIKQYMDSVRPMHDRFIEPTKQYSDFVLPGWGDNHSALTSLTSLIVEAIQRPANERYVLIGKLSEQQAT